MNNIDFLNKIPAYREDNDGSGDTACPLLLCPRTGSAVPTDIAATVPPDSASA